MNQNTRILPIVVRMPDVQVMTGMSRATVYRMMKDETFPSQIQLSPRAVGWLRTEIEQWIANKLTAQRALPQAA